MKAKTLYAFLLTTVPFMVYARIINILSPNELIANSKLVFVGKVRSVEASGFVTSLSYPTLEGVSFPWLKVEMEVLAPFKGVHKGDDVETMMLSIKNPNPGMYCPPEVLEPEKGDVFFLCVNTTSEKTNAFSAHTGPYDENLSVFPLYRSSPTSTESFRDGGKMLFQDDKRFDLIWTLVNQSGEVLPNNVEKLRSVYAAEIRKAPTNDLVYLEWESRTNAHGWFTDVSKGFCPTNSDSK